jgi:HSP20 family protein
VSKRSARKEVPEERRQAARTYLVGPVTFMEVSDEAPLCPLSDVNEAHDGLIIRVELPGVPPRDIRVLVQGSVIEVSGEKRHDPAGGEVSFLCMERTFGKFRRVFELTGCLDMAGVRAFLKGGVLSVFVPKREERRGQPRVVPVAADPGD